MSFSCQSFPKNSLKCRKCNQLSFIRMQSKSKPFIKIAGNEARILAIIIKQEYYLHDTFYNDFGLLQLESNWIEVGLENYCRTVPRLQTKNKWTPNAKNKSKRKGEYQKQRPQNLKVGFKKQRPQHTFLREQTSSDISVVKKISNHPCHLTPLTFLGTKWVRPISNINHCDEFTVQLHQCKRIGPDVG